MPPLQGGNDVIALTPDGTGAIRSPALKAGEKKCAWCRTVARGGPGWVSFPSKGIDWAKNVIFGL